MKLVDQRDHTTTVKFENKKNKVGKRERGNGATTTTCGLIRSSPLSIFVFAFKEIKKNGRLLWQPSRELDNISNQK